MHRKQCLVADGRNTGQDGIRGQLPEDLKLARVEAEAAACGSRVGENSFPDKQREREIAALDVAQLRSVHFESLVGHWQHDDTTEVRRIDNPK